MADTFQPFSGEGMRLGVAGDVIAPPRQATRADAGQDERGWVPAPTINVEEDSEGDNAPLATAGASAPAASAPPGSISYYLEKSNDIL
eukprot:2089064-Pyramimonas_sp.AAC.1